MFKSDVLTDHAAPDEISLIDRDGARRKQRALFYHGGVSPLTLRDRAALRLGDAVSNVSRRAGKGSGGVIGSRVALLASPQVLAHCLEDLQVVLITGTNGKSTATALTVAALGVNGPVLTNGTGANMVDGLLSAVQPRPLTTGASTAVLEMDEMYLGAVVSARVPAALVVLNISREYTRGVSLRRTLLHWRDVAQQLDHRTSVIANVDDPLVQWAFEDVPRLVPVAGGLTWTTDATLCPACHTPHEGLGEAWRCPGCGRGRRTPVWSLRDHQMVTPSGPLSLTVALDGLPSRRSALMALACVDALGGAMPVAAEAIRRVTDVDGRYAPLAVGQHHARLSMLKNPAGWAEVINATAVGTTPLSIVVEPFGPRDTTTVWEAPWHLLRGRRVPVAGARRWDVVAALHAHGVDTCAVATPTDAVTHHPVGDVSVACNYPAFRTLSTYWQKVHA